MPLLSRHNLRAGFVVGPAFVAVMVLGFSLIMRPFPEFEYWAGVSVIGVMLAMIGASRWMVAVVILLAGLSIICRTEFLDWEKPEFSHRPQQRIANPVTPVEIPTGGTMAR